MWNSIKSTTTIRCTWAGSPAVWDHINFRSASSNKHIKLHFYSLILAESSSHSSSRLLDWFEDITCPLPCRHVSIITMQFVSSVQKFLKDAIVTWTLDLIDSSDTCSSHSCSHDQKQTCNENYNRRIIGWMRSYSILPLKPRKSKLVLIRVDSQKIMCFNWTLLQEEGSLLDDFNPSLWYTQSLPVFCSNLS